MQGGYYIGSFRGDLDINPKSKLAPSLQSVATDWQVILFSGKKKKICINQYMALDCKEDTKPIIFILKNRIFLWQLLQFSFIKHHC